MASMFRQGALALMLTCALAPAARSAEPDWRQALASDWLVSDWPAGQSPLVLWRTGNVRIDRGDLTLHLTTEPDTGRLDMRPLAGAEVQSKAVAETGIWRWRAQAPRMVEGAVFGLFLYRADHANDPWREYDFEFVGRDTRSVQLNIHFEDAEGKHVALGPVIVPLGFDAAEGMHDYEIEVRPAEAIFRIDGTEVGRFGPGDMPGGVWSRGPLKSFADLWAVGPGQAEWAGTWQDPGRPLVARIERIDLPVSATR